MGSVGCRGVDSNPFPSLTDCMPWGSCATSRSSPTPGANGDAWGTYSTRFLQEQKQDGARGGGGGAPRRARHADRSLSGVRLHKCPKQATSLALNRPSSWPVNSYVLSRPLSNQRCLINCGALIERLSRFSASPALAVCTGKEGRTLPSLPLLLLPPWPLSPGRLSS